MWPTLLLLVLLCFLLTVPLDYVAAIKCLYYNDTDPKPDYYKKEWPKEKTCSAEQSQCIYAKCQQNDGKLVGWKYKMDCLSMSDNVTCKELEKSCGEVHGISHCYRCEHADNCNDGKQPKLRRCYNFNKTIALEMDKLRGLSVTEQNVTYPRHLSNDDYNLLKRMKGGVLKCPNLPDHEWGCLNVMCKFRVKRGTEGDGWRAVAKGCHPKSEQESMCEQNLKHCKGGISCHKKCYFCDHDLCNGGVSTTTGVHGQLVMFSNLVFNLLAIAVCIAGTTARFL